MPKWIPCSDGFIAADVVRWTEPVWKRRHRKGSRPIRIGARSVTAQVTQVAARGWIALHVIESHVTEEKPGRVVTEVLKKGQEIRRKRQSILRGKPERLPWSDESARAMLTNRFLGNRH